jgi:hypothetical protein
MYWKILFGKVLTYQGSRRIGQRRIRLMRVRLGQRAAQIVKNALLGFYLIREIFPDGPLYRANNRLSAIAKTEPVFPMI